MRILITGGAGFIGLHLSRRLLAEGCQVTIFDNFLPQVHGPQPNLDIFDERITILRSDVSDRSAWITALRDQDAVVHLAAETGTGQSMYEVARYERTNLQGTALLMDLLTNGQYPSIRRLIVASSRAIYGEGAYTCETHGLVFPPARSSVAMQSGVFESLCPQCNRVCQPVPTPESAPFQPSSFYGLTKQVQEQMCLLFGRVLDIPTFALRYQNVYGPGQSLKNPYTGILAIFSNLARLGEPIRIFEDGKESRDFVYIDDVVEATYLALTAKISGVHALNVGSGVPISVHTVASDICTFFSSNSEIRITGEFREGDIRHGCADLTEVHRQLGFTPKWRFADGLRQFLEWARVSAADTSTYNQSLDELASRGLLHG